MLAAAVVLAALLPTTAAAAVELGPPTVIGTPGDDGWFVSDVVVKWSPSGETATDGCDTRHLVADTVGTTITCAASAGPGDAVSRTITVRIDRTPPTGVAALPARPPDSAGFYTAPLAIGWSGTDATSGLAACTAMTYAGPDGPAVAPTGSCRDVAGNVSAPVGLTLAYDATAPALSGVVATAGADRTVAVRWTAGADARAVTVVRLPGGATVLDGPGSAQQLVDGPLAPGSSYTYTVTVRDDAGNVAAATASTTTPAAATTAATSKATKKPRRPTLRWKPRHGATYYNLQLFRSGRKVLSTWPTRARYTLKASWRYRGRTIKLTPGRYRWYVWPGYGPRSAHRYGRLLKRGSVTVRQP